MTMSKVEMIINKDEPISEIKVIVLMHVILVMLFISAASGRVFSQWPRWIGYIIQGVALILIFVIMRGDPSIKKLKKEAAEKEKALENESKNLTELRLKIAERPKRGKGQSAVLLSIYGIGMLGFFCCFLSILLIEDPSVILLKLGMFFITMTPIIVFTIKIYFDEVNDREDSIFFRENHHVLQAVLEELQISKE